VNGRPVVVFGGGDGWLYALDPRTGREFWRYDGNPKGSVWRPTSDRKGVIFRNAIVACPLVHNGRIYLAMGQDTEHGEGKGRLHAIDPGGQGDVTTKRRIWVNEGVGRAISAPTIHEDLLYLADLNGWVHCIDLHSGKKVWAHNLRSAVWGAILVADGKLYVGDEGGEVTVFRTGRRKEIVAKMEFDAPIWCAPAVAGGTLYIATANKLYAMAKKGK
jgi:outer membrane protein assembly factor BamB